MVIGVAPVAPRPSCARRALSLSCDPARCYVDSSLGKKGQCVLPCASWEWRMAPGGMSDCRSPPVRGREYSAIAHGSLTLFSHFSDKPVRSPLAQAVQALSAVPQAAGTPDANSHEPDYDSPSARPRGAAQDHHGHGAHDAHAHSRHPARARSARTCAAHTPHASRASLNLGMLAARRSGDGAVYGVGDACTQSNLMDTIKSYPSSREV